MIKHNKNYHSHIYLCNHATGKPIDYVKEAIKLNFKVLGISDHAPMPILKYASSGNRMDVSDYPLYLELLEEANLYAKSNNLKFYKGLEIEYFSNLDVYQRFLQDLDYLILGQHYIVKDNNIIRATKLATLEELEIYASTVIEALNSGYFNLLCHPDICFCGFDKVTDEMVEILRPVVKKAKELNIPLEFNANGIRREKKKYNNSDKHKYHYPNYKFFKMVKEEDAQVVLSSDAHSLEALYDSEIEESLEIIKELDLNLIDELKMNY